MRNKDRIKQCPFCERYSNASTFRDINVVEDWWTVCEECADKHDNKVEHRPALLDKASKRWWKQPATPQDLMR